MQSGNPQSQGRLELTEHEGNASSDQDGIELQRSQFQDQQKGVEWMLLRLAQIETNIDLKDRRAKVLEGHPQGNKDVWGFRNNSWQRSVA